MPIYEPLASKYRPRNLENFVGQKHLIGDTGPIKSFLESGRIPSMIFWGPPGTGKNNTRIYNLPKPVLRLSQTPSSKQWERYA